MKPNRLSVKSSPATLGLQFYAVVWLLLDRFQPDGWVWGMVGAFCALMLIGAVINFKTSRKYVIGEDGKLTVDP
jgi:hypothetical protein